MSALSQYERLYGAHALRFSCGCWLLRKAVHWNFPCSKHPQADLLIARSVPLNTTPRQAAEVLRDSGLCATARWLHLGDGAGSRRP